MAPPSPPPLLMARPLREELLFFAASQGARRKIVKMLRVPRMLPSITKLVVQGVSFLVVRPLKKNHIFLCVPSFRFVDF